MNNAIIRKAWAHRASRLLPVFTVVALLLCLSVPVHGQQAPARKKPKPLKPPHVMATQVSITLSGNRMPHQMYVRYARYFQGYAITISRKKPSSKAQKARYVWLEKTYREMSGLLTEMGKWAKMRDAIRQGSVNTHTMMKSAAPEGNENKPAAGARPAVSVGAVPNTLYARACREHKTLLKRFDELTLKITPKKPVSTTPPRGG